jgi:hypothetical protein
MISCTLELQNMELVTAAFVLGGIIAMVYACWYFHQEKEG